MWLFKIMMDTHLGLMLVLLLPVLVESLRDVSVTVPTAVRRGDSAILSCGYDMEGDSLYSVKWYKGRREFYRYTPKENPAMKIFPMAGITVNRQMSNESQITLTNVQPSTSGRYSCEVSADAPSFHTQIWSGDLEVVVVPDHRPTISGIRARYRFGDIIRGNCTSKLSKPAANLTWSINEMPANPSHVRPHKPLKDHKTDLETSVLGLHFVVSSQHFIAGKLKIKCTARIHDIYWQINEKSIEEERPKVISAASSSSNSVNLIQNNPYEQFSLHDGDITEKKDSLMTPIQGDMSSLNSATWSKKFTKSLLFSSIFFLLNILPRIRVDTT